MATYRMISVLFLLAMLAGCGDLRQENAELRFALDECRSDQAYWETQAAIAKGCDFLLSICPASMTEAGHEAIKAGFSGASSGWLIFSILGKLIALGGFIGSIIVVGGLGWSRMVRPAREAHSNAIELIKAAEARCKMLEHLAAEAELRQHHAERAAENARQLQTAAELAAEEATLRAQKALMQATRAEDKATRAERARRALDVFKNNERL